MKRFLLFQAFLLVLAVSCPRVCIAGNDRIPVVVITDLYFPGQDVGDNFDLVTPFSLSGIDLKAVVLDVTDDKRVYDGNGTRLRDPAFIPSTQLNYIFDRNVPVACAPFCHHSVDRLAAPAGCRIQPPPRADVLRQGRSCPHICRERHSRGT